MNEVTGLERVHRDLLDLADFAYERLRRRLDGLTDEEYLWEPAEGCWSVRRQADGTFRADGSPAPVEPVRLTTIAWRMCHLIDTLTEPRNATWIGVTPLGTLERTGEPGTAGQAVDQIDLAYKLFRAHVAATDAAGLTAPIGAMAAQYAEHSRVAFILHELDELIHHAAEIATLRDLYRAMYPGTAPVSPGEHA